MTTKTERRLLRRKLNDRRKSQQKKQKKHLKTTREPHQSKGYRDQVLNKTVLILLPMVVMARMILNKRLVPKLSLKMQKMLTLRIRM